MTRASIASLFVSCAALAGAPTASGPAGSWDGPPRGGASGLERGAANGADLCANAPSISGSGSFAFNNTSATTDGLAHPDFCNFFGDPQISRDIWWRWTAECDGVVTMETCGAANFDTELAVYSPLALCAPSSAYLLACNDDACSTQSRVSFVAIAGQEYLIRLGSYVNSGGGTGSLQITCADNTVCQGGGDLCQDVNYADFAYTSSDSFRVADDFVPLASGAVTGICWSGGSYTPITDDFRIVYYRDAAGAPGTPIAAFTQSAGALSV
ncbi:MAG: hypothetical protein IBJ10_09055, partial [Phycisphaerales bacterium]|nr:hypothetical protein [Phycisphaerales bacterium]